MYLRIGVGCLQLGQLDRKTSSCGAPPVYQNSLVRVNRCVTGDGQWQILIELLCRRANTHTDRRGFGELQVGRYMNQKGRIRSQIFAESPNGVVGGMTFWVVSLQLLE